MAFFNRVADPLIGGTYMTMLNTIANLGTTWPNTAALFVVGNLKWTRPCTCVPAATAPLDELLRKLSESARAAIALPPPATAPAAAPCECEPEVVLDGYTITCLGSLAVGAAWLTLMRPRVFALQELPSSAWLTRADKADKACE